MASIILIKTLNCGTEWEIILWVVGVITEMQERQLPGSVRKSLEKFLERESGMAEFKMALMCSFEKETRKRHTATPSLLADSAGLRCKPHTFDVVG